MSEISMIPVKLREMKYHDEWTLRLETVAHPEMSGVSSQLVLEVPKPINPISALLLADSLVKLVQSFSPALPRELMFSNIHLDGRIGDAAKDEEEDCPGFNGPYDGPCPCGEH